MRERDDGFTIADVSSALLDDDRMRALWRCLANQVDMCEAVVTHEAVLLASWRVGQRQTVAQAAPLWLQVRPETVAALVSVGLLDRSERIPTKTWAKWFGPALERREKRRENGAKGGRAPRKPRSSNASALLNPTGRQAGPSSPSVNPSVPSIPRAPRGTNGAKRGGEPTTAGAVLSGMPPFESMIGGKAS